MMDNLADRLFRRTALSQREPTKRQFGCIPYAVVSGQPVFLLITSRRTGRWIFPKGSVIEGLSEWESAAREALEEAGVEGQVGREPIGNYRTVKQGIRRSVLEVTLYPLRVEAQHENWSESHQRHRHWAILPEAKRLITDKALTGLVMRLADRLDARVGGDLVGM